jgi:hypothetical protein
MPSTIMTKPSLARKLLCHLFFFLYIVYEFLILSFVDSGEEEEPAANVNAPTSTSQTLVLSETRRAAEETSPPQQNLEMSTPVASPRAPSPKRVRIELGEGQGLLAGSLTTPSLDDVSTLATILSSVEFFPS